MSYLTNRDSYEVINVMGRRREGSLLSYFFAIRKGNGNDNQLRLNACMLVPAPPSSFDQIIQ